MHVCVCVCVCVLALTLLGPELDEYDSIKLVNFIRRAIYEHRCPLCGLVHTNPADLLAHMGKEKHFGLKKTDPAWRDAQYVDTSRHYSLGVFPSSSLTPFLLVNTVLFLTCGCRYLFPTYENDALLTGFAEWSEEDDEEFSKKDQLKAEKDLGMDELLDQP